MSERVNIITITPDDARKMLAGNIDNRRIKPHVVNAYARDMAADNWRLTGDSIKRNGRKVLDGQHRLLACVQAGVSFRTVLAEGISEEAHAAIDGGAKRNVTDELTWLGIPQANQVASALTLLWKWNNDALEQWRPATKAELLAELERTPWLLDSVRAARAVWEATRINASALACVHAELSRAAMQAKAQDWLDHLAGGVGYGEGDAALALRNYATRVAATKAIRVRGENWLAISIKCFNYWYLGQPIKSLKWRRAGGEDFPILVVDVDGNDD